MEKNDLVSIIITTKNEGDVIKRLLESILKQSYKNVEIILIDNHSSDNTLKIVKAFKKIRVYICGPERSAQRNYGSQKAKGDYLLFLDADMKLSNQVVNDCVFKMKDNRIGALCIPEESIGGRFWEKVKAFERSFYNLAGDEITDAARFFRKKVFEKVGGYNEALTGPEDWELTEKVRKSKYSINRISAVIYHYEVIPNIYFLLKKKYYYGLKSSTYLKKNRISLISPKTIYFLRPVFYRNWQRMASRPALAVSMFIMFSLELVAGALGYLKGKYFE